MKQNNTMSKIFAFACIDMVGHFMPMMPFIRELLQRGHSVTVFVPESFAKQLHEFGAADAQLVSVEFPLSKMEDIQKLGLYKIFSRGGPLAVKSDPLFAAITGHYRTNNRTLPSMIVADFFSNAARDAGDALGVPVVTVFPNPFGVISGLPAPSQRSCKDKVKAMGLNIAEGVGARLMLLLRNRERSLRGLPAMLEQDVYPCGTMKRLFINTWGLGYEYPALQSPLLHFVGPTEPLTYPEIRADLKSWLDEQKGAIVYVAFGTVHKFTPATCAPVFKALERLTSCTDDGAQCGTNGKSAQTVQGSISVLWSLPKDQQSLCIGDEEALARLRSKNIRIESFVPQYAVLKHPKVVCFVTHSGANSVSESILAETPMVCCPSEASDQPANACRVQSAGVGVIAEGGIIGGMIDSAVRKVLANLDEHTIQVCKLKGILLSYGGAKRAADVLEAVAKTDGYGHMVPMGNRFPYVKTIGFLVAAAALAVCGWEFI